MVDRGVSACPTLVCLTWFISLQLFSVQVSDVLSVNPGIGGSNAVALLEQPPLTNRRSRSGALGQSNGQLSNGHNVATNGNSNGIINGNGHTNGHVNGHVNGHANGHDNHHSRGHRIYAFSAKSDISLSTYLSSFSHWLDEASDTPEFLDNLAFTLGPRRSHFAYRFAAVADSVSSLQDQIRSFSKSTRSRPPVVAFVFTGQGAQ